MKVKDFRQQLSLMYLGYISNIVLMVALGLGLYTQWQFTENTAILIIAMMGLLVFGISCVLQYYFSYTNTGQALLHIWLGCILGIIIFSDQQEIEYVTTQEVMDILLLTSMGLGWFWNILERLLHLAKHQPQITNYVESLECLGLSIATLVVGKDAVAISLIIVAFSCNLTAIRFKSFLGLLNFSVLITISTLVFFKDLNISVNIYGLACFVGRHSFPPIIDLYFSGLSTLERWQSFFNLSKLRRHLIVIAVLLLNFTICAIVGRLSVNHKEWFIVIPLFAVFAIVWLFFHIIAFITCWKLMSKVTECNLTFNSVTEERKNMNRIMSAKGIRHFSLISQRLICISLITTLILLAIGWTTRTTYSLSLFMVILPIECMTLSLFWELGDFLGGTAIGYAIIGPSAGQRPSSGPTLIPGGLVQEIGTRATSALNKMNQFFNYHMVDNFGCDFSTSGIAPEYLETKVKGFFDRKTTNGPRFDTYILYYSGDVYDNGDWALSDNRNLKIETLLEWWYTKNGQSGTRLILILDTVHSWHWMREVGYIRDEFVAIQTCRFVKGTDPEYGGNNSIGSFTEDFVLFNQGAELDPSWNDKNRSLKAAYKVSRNWTDFTFHLPTTEDINEHWDTNFPKVTKPLVRAVNFGGYGSACFCCDCLFKCLRRKKMKWLPPKELETGHGFKLVRS